MHPRQQEIIQALKVEPTIDPEFEIRRSIDFMKDYLLRYQGLYTLVLGISGGQDSTLVGRLAQLAVEELREETQIDLYQFIAVRLPYGQQNDEADAQLALDFILADQEMTVNIRPSVQQLVQQVELNDLELSHYNIGNIKARARMMAQYAIAGQLQGAVLGSDHAAEAVTGFYTKFGDGAADLMPIWRLTKRQGTQLLQALNAPSDLYTKVPTADLEDDRPMIADEEVLGVTYEEIDNYLEGHAVSDQAATTIEQLYAKSEHKRHLPINVYDTFWRE